MHLGLHHRQHRRGRRSLSISPGIIRAVDALTYAMSALMLFFTVHQVWLIWSAQDATGVSLVAWLSYTLGSFVWLMYGYVHLDSPIIITNFLWTLLCSLVVLGIILF